MPRVATEKERTLKRTVDALNTAGVQLPRRKGAMVTWARPQIASLAHTIKNPS